MANNIPWRRLAPYALGVVAINVIAWWPSSPPRVQVPAEVWAVLEDTQPTPSTIKFVSYEALADEGVHHLARVEFDAQNENGAMIRKRLCVEYKVVGTQIQWSRSAGTYPCHDRPSDESIRETRAAWKASQ